MQRHKSELQVVNMHDLRMNQTVRQPLTVMYVHDLRGLATPRLWVRIEIWVEGIHGTFSSGLLLVLGVDLQYR